MTKRSGRAALEAALSLGILAGWSAPALAADAPPSPPIRLQPEGHFETPGFALLVYHNDYLVGRRGGLQAFLHGRRVFDAGELVARGTDGKDYGTGSAKMGARVVDAAAGTATVPGKVAALGLDFRITTRTDGRSVLATVVFDRPLDWTKVASVGLKLELFPEQFWHKSYLGDGKAGVFPERNNGPRTFVAAAHEIRLA
ncbi:MAG TPA: hypothetical protein VEQ10_10835, partial [Vicinamibacteria bacterium]|nr:hypothetical protein [Vicinamibacteria bacterium]